MERPWFFLINLVALVVIAFVFAYRQSAKGRRGWPGMHMLTVLASVSAVLLLLVAVSVYRSAPGKLVSSSSRGIEQSLEKQHPELKKLRTELEKLPTWKPDADSVKVLDEYNRLVDVAITEAGAPQHYTIQFAPESSRNYRYVTFTTVYHNIDIKGIEKQSERTIEVYDVATKRSDQGELLIETQCKKFWMLPLGADKAQEMPVSAIHSLWAVRDGDVYHARQEGTSLNVEKSPLRGADKDRIAFDLPKDGIPQIGKRWSSATKGESFESQTEHTLVGFATVQGIFTAKFVSKGETTVHSTALAKQAKDASEQVAKEIAKLKSKGMKNLPSFNVLFGDNYSFS